MIVSAHSQCSCVESAWCGLDTLIVTAGVSALQPLMAVAGVEMSTPDIVGSQASPEGVQHAVNAANAAVKGNFIGPYVAAVTFVSAGLAILFYFAKRCPTRFHFFLIRPLLRPYYCCLVQRP